MPTIALLMAMQDEARPVIETLGLAHAGPLAPPLPMQRYSGKADQAEIDLVILGKDSAHGVDCIGTVSAALAAREAIRLLKPDMLLNAGTCGGFVKRGGAIGKVYVSGGPFWFHDRRVPLPGFEDFARGGWRTADAGPLAEALALEQAVVTTGDSLDMHDDDAARIEKVGAHAKDMEAAAIAWVATQHETPMLSLKAVTDLVDGAHPTEQEFLENLHTASAALADKVVKTLRWCATQPAER